jgi:hypothetical protein
MIYQQPNAFYQISMKLVYNHRIFYQINYELMLKYQVYYHIINEKFL